MTADTMQTIWARQAPRRMRYQPSEMKTVLIRLKVALTAGRSDMENTLNR